MSFVKFLHGEDPFVRVPNETARDVRLTANSLSALTFAGSFSESHTLSFADFKKRFGWGRDATRTVFRNLEETGYGQRQHRVRQQNGRLATVTTLSFRPIFANKRTGGGSSAPGSSASGQPSLIKRSSEKDRTKKKARTKQYRRKAPGTRASEEEVEAMLGIRLPHEVRRLGDPERVARLLLGAHFRGENGHALDAGASRHVLGEFVAQADQARDPWALLENLSRLAAVGQINLSPKGEAKLPDWL